MSSYNVVLTFHLFLHLTCTDEIWYHSMDTASGWTETPPEASYGSSSSNCYSSACVVLEGTAQIQYDGIDTTNYHNIQLQYSIQVSSYESSDTCTIAYSKDENNWTNLKQYGINDNDRRYDEQLVNMNNDASHQNSLSIRFKTDAEANDNCYVDELHLYGLPPTQSPTVNPTVSPTQNPSNNPTNNPTKILTNNPTKIPTNIPSNIPTNIPTKIPTKIPTNIPTKIPTNIPTNFPTQIPTKFPTNTPIHIETNMPTNRPTNGASNQIVISSTFSTVMDTSKGPTLSPNVVNMKKNVLSNEYMMENWYYLLIGAIIFFCIFCVIILCFSLKMRKMRETEPTGSTHVHVQDWVQHEIEIQLQLQSMNVFEQQQIQRTILDNKMNNKLEVKQVGEIHTDEDDIEDMWDVVSNMEDPIASKTQGTTGNNNGKTTYDKNRMSVDTTSEEGSHVQHDINDDETMVIHQETSYADI